MNDVLNAHFGETVTEEELEAEANSVEPPLRTREELAYYRIFSETFPGLNVDAVVGRWVDM